MAIGGGGLPPSAPAWQAPCRLACAAECEGGSYRCTRCIAVLDYLFLDVGVDVALSLCRRRRCEQKVCRVVVAMTSCVPLDAGRCGVRRLPFVCLPWRSPVNGAIGEDLCEASSCARSARAPFLKEVLDILRFCRWMVACACSAIVRCASAATRWPAAGQTPLSALATGRGKAGGANASLYPLFNRFAINPDDMQL